MCVEGWYKFKQPVSFIFLVLLLIPILLIHLLAFNQAVLKYVLEELCIFICNVKSEDNTSVELNSINSIVILLVSFNKLEYLKVIYLLLEEEETEE